MVTEYQAGSLGAALWISHRAASWAAEGKSADDIAALIHDLTMVVIDWHDGLVEVPAGEPWRWSHSDIDHFIAMRKSEWR